VKVRPVLNIGSRICATSFYFDSLDIGHFLQIIVVASSCMNVTFWNSLVQFFGRGDYVTMLHSTWRAAPLKSAMRVLMAPIGGGPACGVLYAFLCQANEAMENLQQYWNWLFTHQVEPSNLRVRRVEAGQVRPHHRIRRCSGLCHFFSHVPDALIFTCSSCPLVKPNLWCCAWCLGWSNVMICSLLLRPPLFSYIGAVTRSQKIRILRCVAIFCPLWNLP